VTIAVTRPRRALSADSSGKQRLDPQSGQLGHSRRIPRQRIDRRAVRNREGQTNPPGVDGRPATTVFPKPLAQSKYSSRNPGGRRLRGPRVLVAGVLRSSDDTQGVPSGAVSVVVQSEHIQSAGLTVSVK